MAISCPQCASTMPETAAFCPGCGRPMQASAHGRVGPLPENIAGALAYFTIVPAILFLVLAPYNTSRFLRFHSFQCLFLSAASLVVGAALKLVGLVLLFIPILGHLLIVLMSVVIAFAFVIAWFVLVIKALQGESFKLPVIGDFADQLATSS